MDNKKLLLLNGVLYEGVTVHDEIVLTPVYEEADYFADAEEAQRWLLENGSNATVVEGGKV